MMQLENIINQLKWSLQALAVDAESQIKSFPDFVVVTDELLLEFGNYYQIAISSYNAHFANDQLNSLNTLASYIDSYNENGVHKSFEEELHNSVFWKELREIARHVLAKFNWPLEPPPLERVTYIRS